jgi:hypothetical protein
VASKVILPNLGFISRYPPPLFAVGVSGAFGPVAKILQLIWGDFNKMPNFQLKFLSQDFNTVCRDMEITRRESWYAWLSTYRSSLHNTSHNIN